MSDTHRLRHADRSRRKAPRRPAVGPAVGLGLVVAAFGSALAWLWWPPAVLAGYLLLAASTLGLLRGWRR
jgi:hypothetical protein